MSAIFWSANAFDKRRSPVVGQPLYRVGSQSAASEQGGAKSLKSRWLHSISQQHSNACSQDCTTAKPGRTFALGWISRRWTRVPLSAPRLPTPTRSISPPQQPLVHFLVALHVQPRSAIRTGSHLRKLPGRVTRLRLRCARSPPERFYQRSLSNQGRPSGRVAICAYSWSE